MGDCLSSKGNSIVGVERMSQLYYVDLHCHVLPGVDDGAQDVTISHQMIEMAVADGIGQIVVTPHYKAHKYNESRERIEQLVQETQAWVDAQGYTLKLYTGNEIKYFHEMTNLLKEQKICTLADSFYVLVEFTPGDDYSYIRHGVKEILAAGYYPVVAHIERYEALSSHEKYIEELVDMGAYMQVNAASIEGRLGFITKHKVIKWIKNGLVHLVASDAHTTHTRIPNLSKSAQIIEKKCGIEAVQELYHDNQQKIIANELI